MDTQETQVIKHIKYRFIYSITKYIAVFWSCISEMTNYVNESIMNSDANEPIAFMEHKSHYLNQCWPTHGDKQNLNTSSQLRQNSFHAPN